MMRHIWPSFLFFCLEKWRKSFTSCSVLPEDKHVPFVVVGIIITVDIPTKHTHTHTHTTWTMASFVLTPCYAGVVPVIWSRLLFEGRGKISKRPRAGRKILCEKLNTRGGHARRDLRRENGSISGLLAMSQIGSRSANNFMRVSLVLKKMMDCFIFTVKNVASKMQIKIIKIAIYHFLSVR